MGLDMYLYRREYVSGWEHSLAGESEGRREMYNSLLQYFGAESCEGSPHIYVYLCVAYWRKANAVHKWFCDLDGGKDECQNIFVTRGDLVKLRDLAMQAIREPAMAADVLPTQQGFFFGSYDYDEWYMEDMKNTVDQIDEILRSTPEDSWVEFVYRASW